jgi:serine/threonine protein phosphatase PrpC
MDNTRFHAFGASHVGMKRKQNQDSFLVDTDLGLFIVADGMGGHLGGEVASKLAVETIADSIRQKMESRSEALAAAIDSANTAIWKKAADNPALRGMGTTTTALFFFENTLHIGHVGDSRCYLILTPGQIWQLTRDHSLVQEKLRAGLITRDQVKTDRMKNVITRSVGFEERVSADIYQMSYHKGDVFVVCCDGVSNMLSDAEICSLVTHAFSEGRDEVSPAQALIDAANERGADDNVTAVVIKAL